MGLRHSWWIGDDCIWVIGGMDFALVSLSTHAWKEVNYWLNGGNNLTGMSQAFVAACEIPAAFSSCREVLVLSDSNVEIHTMMISAFTGTLWFFYLLIATGFPIHPSLSRDSWYHVVDHIIIATNLTLSCLVFYASYDVYLMTLLLDAGLLSWSASL